MSDHDFTWLDAAMAREPDFNVRFDRLSRRITADLPLGVAASKCPRDCMGCGVTIIRNKANMGPSGSYCMNCLAERG